LEDLELCLTNRSNKTNDHSLFNVTDLAVEGATIDGSNLVMSSKLRNLVETCSFKWQSIEIRSNKDKAFAIPIYTATDRKELAATIYILSENMQVENYMQRGVAMVLTEE